MWGGCGGAVGWSRVGVWGGWARSVLISLSLTDSMCLNARPRWNSGRQLSIPMEEWGGEGMGDWGGRGPSLSVDYMP